MSQQQTAIGMELSLILNQPFNNQIMLKPPGDGTPIITDYALRNNRGREKHNWCEMVGKLQPVCINNE
jgi:hypothetical protein